MATITRNEKVAGSALANPSVADAIAGALGRDPISGAIVTPNQKWFRFNRSTLKDVTGQHEVTFIRATEGTRINSSGYIETVATGTPRYTAMAGGGPIKGIISELAKTNLAKHSETFSTDDSAWAYTNCTRSIDSTVTNMFGNASMKQTATGGVAQVGDSFTWTADKYYCVSVYVRKGNQTSDRNRLVAYKQDSTLCYADFRPDDLDFVAHGNTESRGFEVQELDGWIRYWLVFQNNSVTGAGAVYFYIGGAGSIASGEYCHWCCINIEEVRSSKSKPSSWIPTEGSAVARNADSLEIENDDMWAGGTTHGLAYLEMFYDSGESVSYPSTEHILTISYPDNSSVNYIYIRRRNVGTVDCAVVGILHNNWTTTPVAFPTDALSAWSKWALRFSVGEQDLYVNGSSIISGAISGTPRALEGMGIATGIARHNQYNEGLERAIIKEFRVGVDSGADYTDAELAELTT